MLYRGTEVFTPAYRVQLTEGETTMTRFGSCPWVLLAAASMLVSLSAVSEDCMSSDPAFVQQDRRDLALLPQAAETAPPVWAGRSAAAEASATSENAATTQEVSDAAPLNPRVPLIVFALSCPLLGAALLRKVSWSF